MRLCTLVASYAQASSPFGALDPYPAPHLWVPEHEWETVLVEKISAVKTVRAAVKRVRPDVFVNLCDGCWEEEQAGIDVVIELERLGQAFTGPPAAFFEPTRHELKLVCQEASVASPRYVFATEVGEAELALSLRFPLLVKPINGYGSIGISRKSRVLSKDELFSQVAQTIAEHGGALVEELIEGRELTVLVAEPGPNGNAPVYSPTEILFPEGETFKHFDLKWRDYAALGTRAVEDAALEERLRDSTQRVFRGFSGAGYARADYRLDKDGELYLLDLNPNPGVFYPPDAPGSADLILQRSPGGHRAFLEHITNAARCRRDAQKRRWVLRDVPELGSVAVAAMALGAGEQVYPLGPSYPEGRFPVGHGDDPNLQLSRGSFVARRAIAAGEPLTVAREAPGRS